MPPYRRHHVLTVLQVDPRRTVHLSAPRARARTRQLTTEGACLAPSEVVLSNNVLCRPQATDFLVTGSVDGHLKFWKKKPEGVEFVKHFRAHKGAIAGEEAAGASTRPLSLLMIVYTCASCRGKRESPYGDLLWSKGHGADRRSSRHSCNSLNSALAGSGWIRHQRWCG
jgi:hypothetical protein